MAGLITSAVGNLPTGALTNTALGPVVSVVSGITETIGLVQQAGPGIVVYTVSAEVNGVLTQIPVVGAPAACLFKKAVSTLTLITGEGSTILEPVIGSITAGGTNVIPVVIASATGAMSADPTAVLGSLAAATGSLASLTGAATDIAGLLTCLASSGTGVPTGVSVPTGGVSVPTGGVSVPTGGISAPIGGSTMTPVGIATSHSTSPVGGLSSMSLISGSPSMSMPKFTNAAAMGVVANNQLMGFMTVIVAFVSLMFGSGFLFMMI